MNSVIAVIKADVEGFNGSKELARMVLTETILMYAIFSLINELSSANIGRDFFILGVCFSILIGALTIYKKKRDAIGESLKQTK